MSPHKRLLSIYVLGRWQQFKCLSVFLVFKQEVHLQRFESSLVLFILEFRLVHSLVQHFFSFIKCVRFDQRNNGVEMHRVPLILSQVLVLLQLGLDPLCEFLPVEGANHVLENGSVEIVYLT